MIAGWTCVVKFAVAMTNGPGSRRARWLLLQHRQLAALDRAAVEVEAREVDALRRTRAAVVAAIPPGGEGPRHRVLIDERAYEPAFDVVERQSHVRLLRHREAQRTLVRRAHHG